jgi:hypothetical protein
VNIEVAKKITVLKGGLLATGRRVPDEDAKW